MSADLPWVRLAGAVGAELSGYDVRSLDPHTVLRASAQHQLLVFRDQSLDPAALTAFAESLGELDQYPYAEPLSGYPFVVPIIKNPEDRANFGGDWHTDTSYLERPRGSPCCWRWKPP
jgi:taurine dioxygenase